MELTQIKLPRTTQNGLYLNPNLSSYYNATGKGLIVNAEPWVQRYHKQLWVDGVCINPNLYIAPLTHTVNGNTLSFSLASLTQTVNQQTGECSQRIEFDPAALKTYFQANNRFFNNLQLFYCTRAADNNVIIEPNNTHPSITNVVIYEPTRSLLPTITLGRNIMLTVNNNNTNVDIQSEYISTISIKTGTEIEAAIQNDEFHVEPEDASNLSTKVDPTKKYIVIRSTFGLYKFMPLSDLQDNLESVHDELQIKTSVTNPPENENYFDSNDIILYTNSVSESSVRLYHSAIDSNTQQGTDIHFKLPRTNNGGTVNVELVVATIDGGEIADPQSEVVTPSDNQ